jgi:hypothetical protein
VTVVQVGQEGPVRGTKILAIEVEWVLVQMVLETDQRRLAVLGVDPRPGKVPLKP